jgi:hypothetical protein|tara:strand:- start:130 stop:492 length:363 start_codon:yes stop_codon:yes gene_type:complete
MNLDLLHVVLLVASIISLGISALLFTYAKKVIAPMLAASEESAEMFTRINSYSEHLKSVYELPTFYGDDTLASLLEHTKELFAFLQRYEDIYSFTQPNLLEALEKIDDEYYQEEAQEKEE